MAREHRADDRPLHPGRLLTPYPVATIGDGPWPGRLGFGPAPLRETDPDDIAAWGAAVVLGLTTPEEASHLRWPDVAQRFASAGLRWRNAPIRDFEVPDTEFERAWPGLRDDLAGILNGGGSVLVHCRGGRGRSGMISAALLVAGGLTADQAIAAVRQVNPAAIETGAQLAWVRRQSAPSG